MKNDKEPGMEIFEDAPIPCVVYRPQAKQSIQQTAKEQLELTRELQALQFNQTAVKVIAWGFIGSFGLLALAVVTLVLRSLFQPAPVPAPQPIVQPSPTPPSVQVNPSCQIWCGANGQ